MNMTLVVRGIEEGKFVRVASVAGGDLEKIVDAEASGTAWGFRLCQ